MAVRYLYKLISKTDPVQVEWHESLTMSASEGDKPFNLHNELDLNFNEQNV